MNVGSLYIVEGPVERVQGVGPGTAESIASCNPGDFVISGGFNFEPPNSPDILDLQFVSSNPTQTLDGWTASIGALGNAGAQIQATAVCFDVQ